MQNFKLIDQYMQFNKILLATINIEKKTIDLFDGKTNKVFNYRDFFIYISEYFNLEPSFIDKAVVVVETIDPNNEILEIDAEYKKKNGTPVEFIYYIIKQPNNEFLLSIKENEVKEASHLDQMTKANPKSYIDNRAKNNMLSKTPFVLMYIDIDNFKHINDEFGQLIGDMILIEMVSVAKNILGDRGAISRVGGDRFLVIYDIDDDYHLVHDFIFNLKQDMQRLSTCSSRGISVTLTIGSAQYPSDGPYELLLKKCMKALIRGKNKGRDCFIMYLVDKCGVVTMDDEITDKVVKIDNTSAKNDVYSLITNINQLLSDEKMMDESVDRAIQLIGNYFYIDRVSIARLDIKTLKIKKHHACYNPKISIIYKAYCNDDLIEPWGKALGAKKYLKVDDSRVLDDNHPLKNIFPIDNTIASMAFDLNVNNKSFGLIRFDMTTGPRHWQPEDFQVFLLISQLFASYFQKNYLKETNYTTFYKDPSYKCNNFTKMFTDAGDMIITNGVNKYSVIEVDLRNIVTYKSIIGKKRMAVLVNSMVDVFENTKDCIYGKYHEGPFVIFLPHHDKAIIEKLINDISDLVDKFTELYNYNELGLQSGIYLADARTDSLVDSLSYANMTRQLNKNQMFIYYSDDIKNKALLKTEMILRLDEALDNGEFLLYLQPKISTVTGKLIGAEALTRWNYKNEKLMFPDQFISLFEEQGVIEKLDFNVFENVCKYQRNLMDTGHSAVPISVNVSRYVTNFDEYLKKIEVIRNKYRIDAKYIEIEITEGMYYENSTTILKFINNLHSVGYKVSMDDFGSGYSNLVSIAKLNFDVIKFDRSFCMDLDNKNVKLMLLKLIDLVKALHMYTICEGVETKENVDYLTKIGCDSIQGYFYSKPIPWQDFFRKYYVANKG